MLLRQLSKKLKEKEEREESSSSSSSSRLRSNSSQSSSPRSPSVCENRVQQRPRLLLLGLLLLLSWLTEPSSQGSFRRSER